MLYARSEGKCTEIIQFRSSTESSVAVIFHVAENEVRVLQLNTLNRDTWLQTNFAELALLMSKGYHVDMQH